MAVIFAIGMAGTTLPTPIYPLYQQHLNLNEFMVAVIFATYAFGILGALILTGPWSDQIGRRPMLYAALACSAASSLLFLFYGSLWGLLLGRALSGLSAGLFTATATIAVIELAPDRRKTFAAMLAAAANMGGLGLGPLLSGTVSQYLPGPLQLVYLAYLALLIAAGAIVTGLGQGAIFAASIVAVTAASPADKRAEVTSLLFVVVYLAVAVPVLGLGIAVEYIGLRSAGITFSILVMLLSIAAVAVLKMHRIKPSVGT